MRSNDDWGVCEAERVESFGYCVHVGIGVEDGAAFVERVAESEQVDDDHAPVGGEFVVEVSEVVTGRAEPVEQHENFGVVRGATVDDTQRASGMTW